MDNWESSKLKQGNLNQPDFSIYSKIPKLNLIEEDSLLLEGHRVKEILSHLENKKVQIKEDLERVHKDKLQFLEQKEKESLKLADIGRRV